MPGSTTPRLAQNRITEHPATRARATPIRSSSGPVQLEEKEVNRLTPSGNRRHRARHKPGWRERTGCPQSSPDSSLPPCLAPIGSLDLNLGHRANEWLIRTLMYSVPDLLPRPASLEDAQWTDGRRHDAHDRERRPNRPPYLLAPSRFRSEVSLPIGSRAAAEPVPRCPPTCGVFGRRRPGCPHRWYRRHARV